MSTNPEQNNERKKGGHRVFLSSRSRGYTLVEILIVVAIIAALAGISTPIIMRQIDTAAETKASVAMKDIEVVINTFIDDNHGMAPRPAGIHLNKDATFVVGSNQLWLLQSLIGEETQVNLKGKKYFDAPPAINDKYGIVRNKENEAISLMDPWGKPYRVSFDYSGDEVIDIKNQISPLNPSCPVKDDIVNNRIVGVFTVGKTGKWGPHTLCTWRDIE